MFVNDRFGAAVAERGAEGDEREVLVERDEFAVAIGVSDLNAFPFTEIFVVQLDGFRCSGDATQFARRKNDFAVWLGGDSECSIGRLDIHRITFVLDRHCTLPPPCIGRQKNETEGGKELRSYESAEGYFHK